MPKSTAIKLPYRLLVFDWDGTLMNSTGHMIGCLQLAAADCGLEVPDFQVIYGFLDLSFVRLVEHLFPTLNAVDYFKYEQRYRYHYFQEAGFSLYLFPKVRETLTALKKQKYLIGVATEKPRASLKDALEGTGLDELIDVSKCANETVSKPHPQMLVELMQEVNVKPQETLMVGDSEKDLQLAMNANVDSISLDYGFSKVSQTIGFSPLAVLHEINDLIPWLEKRKRSKG